MSGVYLTRRPLALRDDELIRLSETLRHNHYVIDNVRVPLGIPDLEENRDWIDFYQSWGDLPRDDYMADDGTYRERRFRVFDHRASTDDFVVNQDLRHFQSKTYNTLNGGIEREYQPIESKVINNPVFSGLLSCSLSLVDAQSAARNWRIEAHQFRILANEEQPGKPTPEGIHQDGVDYVFVAMIDRHNIMGGITRVYSRAGKLLHSMKMRRPLDLLMLDDAEVFHYVTPVKPLWPDLPSWRDVLVLTFRATT